MLCTMKPRFLCVLVAVWLAPLGTAPAAAACDPEGGVQFVCNQSGPEDLVAVPRSPWVLASSYPEGEGGIRAPPPP